MGFATQLRTRLATELRTLFVCEWGSQLSYELGWQLSYELFLCVNAVGNSVANLVRNRVGNPFPGRPIHTGFQLSSQLSSSKIALEQFATIAVSPT